jgi:Patatin-like phospholipase
MNASEPVLSLHDVLIEELGTLSEAESKFLEDYRETADGAERDQILCSLLHHRKRSALCISGGGIRSATFALGVLQGFAKRSVDLEDKATRPCLLADFDFLSTVSGGGYVGSWFSSWMQRVGISAVLHELAERPAKKIDPEARPILYLRNYTNYLNPHLGLFSGDTWALVATTVRNVLLNWFVLIPFLAATLLIPVLYTLVLDNSLPLKYDWPLWLGFVFGVIGTGTLLHNLPSFGNNKGDEQVFIRGCLAPLIATAVCISTWWHWVPTNLSSTVPWYYFAAYGAAIHLGGLLLAIVLSKASKSDNFDPKNLKWLRLLFTFPAAMVTGGLGAWLIWLKADAIHDLPINLYACIAVPLVQFTLMTVGVLSVGISSKVTTDDDREWWSRAGGWMMIAALGWLVFFALVLLLPELIKLETMTWKAKGSFSAVSGMLAWYVTKMGSKSKSVPADAEAGPAPQSPTLMDKLEPWLMPGASILFLAALGFGITLLNSYLATVFRGHLVDAGIPHGAHLLLLLAEVSLALAASYGAACYVPHALNPRLSWRV